MTQRFQGFLRGNGSEATCFITIDTDRAEYMLDGDVIPTVADGEYDLEVNGVHKRAIRTNGIWMAIEY